MCDRRGASRVGPRRGFGALIAPQHGGLAALLPGLAPLAAGLAATRAMRDACDDPDGGLDEAARAVPASGELG